MHEVIGEVLQMVKLGRFHASRQRPKLLVVPLIGSEYFPPPLLSPGGISFASVSMWGGTGVPCSSASPCHASRTVIGRVNAFGCDGSAGRSSRTPMMITLSRLWGTPKNFAFIRRAVTL